MLNKVQEWFMAFLPAPKRLPDEEVDRMVKVLKEQVEKNGVDTTYKAVSMAFYDTWREGLVAKQENRLWRIFNIVMVILYITAIWSVWHAPIK